jgi:hypothetical protein
MKRVIITVIMLLVGMMCAQADDPENKHLHGTWKAIETAEQHDDMLGRIKWESITFSTNRIVEWSWIRDRKAEKHAGRYEIVPDKGEPIYSRLRFDIHLHPTTLAVRRPIVIRDYVVCLDNRFPQSWHVLKWGIVLNQVTTLLREEHAVEWEKFRSDKEANKASEATSEPAPGAGSSSPQG